MVTDFRNNDRRRLKLLGGLGGMLLREFFEILTPSSPCSWFLSNSDRKLSKPFSRFQLGINFSFIKKILYIIKNLTDFHKTVETGMDTCLQCNTFYLSRTTLELVESSTLTAVLDKEYFQYNHGVPFPLSKCFFFTMYLKMLSWEIFTASDFLSPTILELL